MAIGGFVAVGVPDADVFAVAAFPADLVNDAVARGKDRSARRRAPVDPGVHLVVAEQRMVPAAEAGRYVAVCYRFADQEFLGAFAGLVVVVDGVVVARLIAVEFSRLSAGGQQSEQHIALAVVARVFILAGVQHLEGIAWLNLALEI